MENTPKLRGKLKTANPGVGGGDVKMYPILATVKDNIDPNNAGRIRVLLGDKPPTDSNDSSHWVTVSKMSQFGGSIPASSPADGTGSYKANPSTFGQWNAPPEIGTKVIVIFINGDVNYGYYIGVSHDAESMQSLPSLGTSANVVTNTDEAQSYGGSTRLPVTNMNTNDLSTTNDSNFNATARPVHSYAAAIHNQQGTLRDTVRGPKSSSASRESPSRVGWGVSSPGRPIYTGGYDDSTLPSNIPSATDQQLQVVSRRAGHNITMDDGDIIGKDQGITIRSALGHQIMMSDDGQTLMILHSNGQSYVELGKEGTVDVYSTNSINLRTQGDLNFHADRDINFNAMANLKIQANAIQINSNTTGSVRTGSDLLITSLGKYTALATGAIAFKSGADASLVGSGQAYVNGSKVNLNSGAPPTTPATVPIIPLIAQTDTLYDSQKGFAAAPAKLLTIATRAPAHAPWANAGQGVDVTTNLDASASLPASPGAAVQQTTEAAVASSSSTPPATATVASVPNVPSVSPALSTDTTKAMLGSVATAASLGPLSSAVKLGSAVVATATGNQSAIGSFALTPSQLASSGLIKPGADTLINGLVNAGANLSQAMPTSVFTGTSGVSNLTNLIQSSTAQTSAVVNNMKQSQTALGQMGVLTGTESAAQIAGLVQSAAVTGINATVGAIQQISGIPISSLTPSMASSSLTGISNSLQGAAGALAGAASGIINPGSISGSINQVGSALKMIGAGSVSASSIGSIGGISSAVNAMATVPGMATLSNLANGISAAAFKAIVTSFTPLLAGVPQNLTAIAHASAIGTATTASQTSQLSTAINSSLSNLAAGIGVSTASLSTVANGLTGVTNGLLAGSINNITSVLNNSTSGITGASSILNKAVSTASGLSGLSPNVTNTTIGGITGISSSISGQVTGQLSTIASGNPIVNSITSAVNNVSSLAGAASISPSNFGALSSAAGVLQQGSAATLSAVAASGVSNLPGGSNAISSVVNNAANAINTVPGVSQLTGLINSAQSSVMTGVSSALKTTLSSLQSASNNLSSIVGGGLNAGELAQLQSAISSLPGGISSVQLPTVGFNTNSRTQITNQITALLGDPAIPKPNLVGATTPQANDINTLVAQAKQQQQNQAVLTTYYNAEQAYTTALQTLPPGDPGIAQAKAAMDAIAASSAYQAAVASNNSINASLGVST